MLVNVSEGGKVDSLLTLKRKTDVNGRPCMNKWCPDSESNQGHGTTFDNLLIVNQLQDRFRNKMYHCSVPFSIIRLKKSQASSYSLISLSIR